MNTLTNYGMTKKDIINAKHCSKSVSEAIDAGLVFEIKGACIVENGATDRKGQPCDVGYIATANDGVFGFISNILIRAIPDIIEILEDGETVSARFISGTSKNDTEYYTIEII